MHPNTQTQMAVFKCYWCCSVLSSSVSFPVCPHRRMTFGKVNELGQFIREAEPEPDVKKSKGMRPSRCFSSLFLLLSGYALCLIIFSALTLSYLSSLLLAVKNINCVPVNINLIKWLPPFSTQLRAF